MGLDTTHNCWHGPYSSFNKFRKAIAKYAGVDLDEMIGFGGNKSFSLITHDIVPLLDHSDCDGEISVEDAKRIVSGLNLIIPNINEEYIKADAIQFRDGCLEAILKNEVIEFH